MRNRVTHRAAIVDGNVVEALIADDLIDDDCGYGALGEQVERGLRLVRWDQNESSDIAANEGTNAAQLKRWFRMTHNLHELVALLRRERFKHFQQRHEIGAGRHWRTKTDHVRLAAA